MIEKSVTDPLDGLRMLDSAYPENASSSLCFFAKNYRLTSARKLESCSKPRSTSGGRVNTSLAGGNIVLLQPRSSTTFSNCPDCHWKKIRAGRETCDSFQRRGAYQRGVQEKIEAQVKAEMEAAQDRTGRTCQSRRSEGRGSAYE